jgi:hypothetical protein
MADHIPFITSQDSLKLASRYYSDSNFARISIDRADVFVSGLANTTKLWLDPSVDGLDDAEPRRPREDRPNSWFEFMQQFVGFDEIGQETFWIKPNTDVVDKFVSALLDFCNKYKPAWLTIPQLPIVSDSSRNKINLALAKATGKWKSRRNFSGRLILPLVFTHQNQLNGKTERNPKVKQATRVYHEAQADGFWVVDQSLTDDSGSKTLRRPRFPGIVDLHTELNVEIPSRIRIAGPYWGLNLVLWARGLIDYPAIGVGTSYQYFLAGGFVNTPAACVAIPSLRRRVGVGRLVHWLDKATKILGTNHPASVELIQIRRQIQLLSASDVAREQVAKFYKSWYELIASKPPAGRSLALFQDLAAAYALGRSLPEFEDEGTARRPESVAEPFMLNCL